MSTTSVEDQRELAEAVRAFLARRSPIASVRAAAESVTKDHASGYDLDLWRAMGHEIGLQSLAIPEEHGGSGAGWVELGVVMQEFGRALPCVPFLSTVGLGVSMLLDSGDAAACATWLPRIAAAEVVATASLTTEAQVRAQESAAGWVLDGMTGHVLDVGIADVLFVLADTDRGPTVFSVDSPAPSDSMCLTPVKTSDPTRRVWQVAFTKTPGTVVGAVGGGAAIAQAALRRARVALAAEQVGVAVAALDMAVEYGKTRRQFGRLIGSFQAVKHKLADVLVATETARSASWASTRAIDADVEDAELISRIATVVCSESAIAAASANVQVHGGIGFTWEHPAHLFVKRSRGNAVLFGTPRDHRAYLSTLVPVLSGRPNPGAIDA